MRRLLAAAAITLSLFTIAGASSVTASQAMTLAGRCSTC